MAEMLRRVLLVVDDPMQEAVRDLVALTGLARKIGGVIFGRASWFGELTAALGSGGGTHVSLQVPVRAEVLKALRVETEVRTIG